MNKKKTLRQIGGGFINFGRAVVQIGERAAGINQRVEVGANKIIVADFSRAEFLFVVAVSDILRENFIRVGRAVG